MKYILIILSIVTISACGQSTLTNHEQKKLEIEKRLTTDKNKIIVLVKVTGQSNLQKVIGETWPENIETTYNILKDQSGQIIYFAEFPTSESGDWTLELKHFFGDNGKLIAFEKRLAYFNEECTDGAVIENVIELYDNTFKAIKTVKTLTDTNGKVLAKEDCGNAYDWTIDKRPTATELMKLKGIRE